MSGIAELHKLIAGLNEPQREAVLHEGGPLLVLAGAGSGKTRVITARIIRLLAEKGVLPHRILGVTFTNKAAKEMMERVEKLYGGPVRGMWLTTFHSAGAQLLRRHPEKIGRNDKFVIYDDSDQTAMVARTMRDLNVNEKIYSPRAIQHQINTAKNFGLSPQQFVANDFLSDTVSKVYPAYEEKMEKANAVDFGDLIHLVVRMFEEHDDVREQYAYRFEHIMVDEFQDTNPVQYKLLQLLASKHNNLCVVGDDDQSIYRWRGADVKNILGFEKDFPGAKTIKLEENYRSTKTILKAAYQVIRSNFGRHDKTIFTENGEGEPILQFTLDDERREADVAASIVRGQFYDKGIPYSEIAIFYRTHAQSRAIEEAFQRLQIPYRVVGGLKFYDRAEVKDLLAYLRVLINRADIVSWERIINTPARGIGDATFQKIEGRSKSASINFWEAMRACVKEDVLGTGPKKKVTDFGRLMAELFDLVGKLPPSGVAREVLARTGYIEALKNEDTPESEARQENLRELLASMEQYEQESETPETLEKFLERVSLVSQVDEEDKKKTDRVTLMTVHAAKGLEFEIVLVTGLEEDTFPHSRSRGDVDEMEEERRLCYVAFTRAKRRLYVLNAKRRRLFGQDKQLVPSRFLSDIPKDLLQASGDATAQRAQPAWSSRGFTPAPSAGAGAQATGGARPVPSWAQTSNARPAPLKHPSRDDIELDPDAIPHYESAPAPSAPSKSGVVIYKIGMRVKHPAFGLGEVRHVNGLGPSGILTVYFQSGGARKIQASFVSPA
jgi:DNA helicase-2/ATP-dependent DNA helicase PcrA